MADWEHSLGTFDYFDAIIRIQVVGHHNGWEFHRGISFLRILIQILNLYSDRLTPSTVARRTRRPILLHPQVSVDLVRVERRLMNARFGFHSILREKYGK